MKFSLVTFGCKLNQAESEKISADLIMNGGIRVNLKSNPDMVIINSCAVTIKAVRECRQKVSYIKRHFPQAKVVVTGCFEDRKWLAVDLWVENKSKHKITELIKNKFDFFDGKNKISIPGVRFDLASLALGRNRGMVKIQDGCDNFCSYCIIPFMRGRCYSVPPRFIVDDILEYEQKGIREVVLTGVNIGRYDYLIIDEDEKSSLAVDKNSLHLGSRVDLVKLLKFILKYTDIDRIRLGSLWPTDISFDLIDLIAQNKRLCPHFHLSIQSGSDQVLQCMNRDYTIAQIEIILNYALKKIELLNFTADIIVGFPGETEADFKLSCELVDKFDFSKVHIFKYSPRPGTMAVKMEPKIGDKEKKKRAYILKQHCLRSAERAHFKFEGKYMDVLWEQKKGLYWTGFSQNYMMIYQKQFSFDNFKNKITRLCYQRENNYPGRGE